jgi:hypothetical protein
MTVASASRREELVAEAARLARESLAPRAAAYDQASTSPVESWRDLWSMELFAREVMPEVRDAAAHQPA